MSSNPLCPCLENLWAYGLAGNLIANVNGKKYDLGQEYGLAKCFPHDEGTPPFCDVIDAPEWCTENWCYIDPRHCDSNITIVLSSYFEHVNDLYYSTEACGSGDDGFSSWYASAGEVGDDCTQNTECYGDANTCNPDGKCGCRFSPNDEDCDAWTAHKVWAFGAYTISGLCYVASASYLLKVFGADVLRARGHCNSHDVSVAPMWGFMSSVFLGFEYIYKLIAVCGVYEALPFYRSKSSYDLTTNVADALGTACGILAYTTLSVVWINVLTASLRLSTVSRSRLRRWRCVVRVGTLAFLAATAALTYLMVNFNIKYFLYYVGLVFFVGLMICLSFCYSSRQLRLATAWMPREERASSVVARRVDPALERTAEQVVLEVEPSQAPEPPPALAPAEVARNTQRSTETRSTGTRSTEARSTTAGGLSDGASRRVELVEGSARWLSRCLAAFLLGGAGWFLARKVLLSVELDRICVIIIYSMHALGLALVGRYIDLLRRDEAQAAADANKESRGSWSCSRRSSDRATSRQSSGAGIQLEARFVKEEHRSLTADVDTLAQADAE